MNRYFHLLAITAALLLSPFSGAVSGNERPSGEFDDRSIAPGGGCTSFCLRNNGYAVFGTNQDSATYIGQVFINKRGVGKRGVADVWGDYPSWTSRYASVTFNHAAFEFAWGGMNEKGLCVSTMALGWSAPPDDGRPYLDGPAWLQYVLDTCATVDEVIATDSDIRIVTVDHYLVSDRYGNCAAIEFRDNVMEVTTGEQMPVAALTNDYYYYCLSLWQQGTAGRFSTAANRVESFTPRSDAAAVDYAFETLHRVRAQAWGNGTTAWSIVFDTKNLRAYFRTRFNNSIRYIDLLRFDLSCNTPVKMLADVHEQLEGDINSELIDFSADLCFQHTLQFWERGGFDNPNSSFEVTRETLEEALQIVLGFTCSRENTDERLVSADVRNIEADPRFALNSRTGDALVVWNEFDDADPSFGNIRSAVLVRTLSGTYNVRESQLLSEADTFNSRPFPIYDEKKDEFLVVWDQADPATPHAESDILGRVVSANGFPQGRIFAVVSNGERNEAPHVYARAARSKPAGPAASKAQLIILFNSVNESNIEDSGLYIAQLSRKFKAKKPRLLIQGVADVGGTETSQRILPSGIGQMLDQTLFLPVVHEMVQGNGTTLDQPMITVVNRSDSLADSENLGIAGDTQPNIAVFENAQGEVIVIGSVLRNKRVVNNVMEYTASAQTPALTPLFESTEKKKSIASLIIVLNPTTAEQERVSLPTAYKTIGYQILAATNGRVYRRGLSEGGMTVGKYKKVFVAGRSLQAMLGVEIPRSGEFGSASAGDRAEILIIWEKEVTREHHEVRARLLSIKR